MPNNIPDMSDEFIERVCKLREERHATERIFRDIRDRCDYECDGQCWAVEESPVVCDLMYCIIKEARAMQVEDDRCG